MGYAEPMRVSIILGIEESEVVDFFLELADREVDMILNRKFGEIIESEITYDVEDRNYFYVNGSNTYDFTIDCTPVTEVLELSIANKIIPTTDYWLDSKQGIIKIDKNKHFIPSGQRIVKAKFNYGFEEVPETVKDFASYIAASTQDSLKSAPVNDNGSPLAEIEIGRYREKYSSMGSYLDTKYGSIIKTMKEMLIQKYKLWCY